MWRKGFAFDDVPRAMLSLSRPPALARRRPLPDEVVESAGGRDTLGRFLEALRSFARETDFRAFYRARRGT